MFAESSKIKKNIINYNNLFENNFNDDYIIALKEQIEEINTLKNMGKGKTAITDFDVALDEYYNILTNNVLSINDNKLALSISSAMEDDQSLILEFQKIDLQELKDRQYALELAEEENVFNFNMEKKPVIIKNDENIKRLYENTYKNINNCLICCEDKICVHLKCNHFYCKECILELFNFSLKDINLVPLSCCNIKIDEFLFRPYVDDDLWKKYEKFRNETENNIKCLQCNNYNKININSNTVDCNNCYIRMCVKCKSFAHNEECKDEIEDIMFITQYAKKLKLSRCPGCMMFVQLKDGCYHITCSKCKTQFCYLCLEIWKKCKCITFEENNLLREINTRIYEYKKSNNNKIVDIKRDDLMEIIRNEENHIHDWKKINGKAICRDCFWSTDNYYYRCSECIIVKCKRCTFNRYVQN